MLKHTPCLSPSVVGRLEADCAVCGDGYTASISFICSKCSANVGGIVLAVGLLLGGLVAAVGLVSYLISGQGESRGGGTGRGLAERVARYIPLQSLKIAIVVWQILIQVTTRKR